MSKFYGFFDFNGQAVILDVDGDTSIGAPTDDQIDYTIGGAIDFQMTANALSVLAGSVVSMGDGTSIQTGAVDSDLFYIKAVDNDDQSLKVVAGAFGAAGTAQYFGLGGSQEFKFYQDGSTSFTGTLTTTVGVVSAPTSALTLLDFQLETEWTGGTIIDADFGGGTTQATAIIGAHFDFNSNLTGFADKDVTGIRIDTPAFTEAGANTIDYKGFHLGTAGALVSNNAGATFNWRGLEINLPNITETQGVADVDGILITMGTATTGGESYGIEIVGASDANFDSHAGLYINMQAAGDTGIRIDQGILTVDEGGSFGGALALNGATTLGHAFMGSIDAITADTGGTAASVVTLVTEITTDGDQNLDDVTLANGTVGQIKHFVVVAEGDAADTVKITPATMSGGTEITFSATPVGEGCTMVYNSTSGWVVTATNGGTIT